MSASHVDVAKFLDYRPVSRLTVEPAAGGQHGITQGFRAETLVVHSPEQLVVRVGFGIGLGRVAGKLVGVAEHHLADHRFYRPVVFDKTHRQVVEQLGVGGVFAGRAEVIHRVHDARPEEVMPNAVGHHARCEWVVWLREPTSKLQAAAGSAADRVGLHVIQHLKEAAFHRLALVSNLATMQQARVANFAVAYTHCVIGVRRFLFEVFNVRAKILQ